MSIFSFFVVVIACCVFSLTLNIADSIEIITAYDVNASQCYELNETSSTIESYGRSHRFYFTLGERQDGDSLVKILQKEITYRTETNATVNVVYPEPNHEGLTLSYVLLKVYQGSDINRIHLVDGGVGQQKLSIDIYANNTKYVQYNATLYGFYKKVNSHIEIFI